MIVAIIRLVELTFVQFALVVCQRQRTAVFNQFEKPSLLVFRKYAGGAATEGSQVPCLARLEGGALGAGETRAREV